jgi:transcriptional regulator with GAF, ATPase, and Fis domain
VRELRSVVQVAAAVHDGSGVLRARDLELGPALRKPTSYHAALDAERRRLLQDALVAADGQRAVAARRLGITPQAISYLVRRLGIAAERTSARTPSRDSAR